MAVKVTTAEILTTPSRRVTSPCCGLIWSYDLMGEGVTVRHGGTEGLTQRRTRDEFMELTFFTVTRAAQA